jgi:ComF family protein
VARKSRRFSISPRIITNRRSNVVHCSFRRWIFPKGPVSNAHTPLLPAVIQRTLASLFNLVFPQDCKVCGQPVRHARRIPVCEPCLAAPAPLAADYFCTQCRTPFLNEAPLDDHGVCGRCRSGLTGYDSAYSYGYYEGALKDLIHLFKYARVESLGEPLGSYLLRAIPLDQRFDLVVPVPLHWRRRLWRGFNQAELLARPLAHRLGVPVGAALERRRNTDTQASLSPSERRSNVAGAFALRRGAEVRGKRILLVDDVLTTGATVGAAAAVLRRAGASHVAVLTLARVDRRPSWATLAKAAHEKPVPTP